jgi:hypothetical protein
MRRQTHTIRIAVPFADDIKEFDTARITRDYQYMLLQALYSPLLEHDYETSQIVTGLAESFRWEDAHFIISLRKNILTHSGYEVTADDVLFTFNRQMKLNSNTHGDLRRLLCGSDSQSVQEDFCNGIQKLDRYTVAFNLKQKNTDIVRSLTSIDFAIIPIPAINSESLKIEDYTETTGPMYYSGKDDNGRVTLKAQKDHWHKLDFEKAVIFSDSYVEIDGQMVPRSIEAFKKGDVDVIPTANIYSYAPDHYGLDFKYDLHFTNPIGLAYFHLTSRGQAKSALTRQTWSKAIQEHLAIHQDRLMPRRILTTQFFMKDGFGGLNSSREEELKRKRSAISKINAEKIIIALHEGVFDTYEKLIGDLPFVVLVREGVNSSEESVDARSAMIDSSFDEDINYLEYLYKENFFPLPQSEAEEWLKVYAGEPDESRRDDLVQDLHLKMISVNPTVIPLFSRPYMACSRNGWILKLPKNYVNTPFWLIRKS